MRCLKCCNFLDVSVDNDLAASMTEIHYFLACVQQGNNNIEHVAVNWCILEILKAKNNINAWRIPQAITTSSPKFNEKMNQHCCRGYSCTHRQYKNASASLAKPRCITCKKCCMKDHRCYVHALVLMHEGWNCGSSTAIKILADRCRLWQVGRGCPWCYGPTNQQLLVSYPTKWSWSTDCVVG